MSQKYCELCKRNVEAKRQIGIGTLLLVIMTAGIWILLIPFYSIRCSLCKSSDLTKPMTIFDNQTDISNKKNINMVTENNRQVISIADEISKLDKLKEKGVISNDEFEKQKQSLLS